MKLSLFFALSCSLACATFATAAPSYLLKSELPAGATTHVTVKLEVGGEMFVPTEKEGAKNLPLKVLGELAYREQIVAWSADAKSLVRSIRDYTAAGAQFEVEAQKTDRRLPDNRRLLLSEIRDGHCVLTANDSPLTREQLDLVNVVGNSLSIDRLLPGRQMKESETWTHDPATIGALLCMDHVAVCDVSSVVAEEKDRQVQIRLAGTVHGTVDGTPTEMELRAAYLFHLDQKRITRFNLAIKEARKSSDIVPGLDVVAKAFVTIDPEKQPLQVPAEVIKIATRTNVPLSRTLVYESPTKNFHFEYDSAWYITAEERDLLAFRYLKDHELEAHCNINVLAARSAGRHTPLEEFERDVRTALGDKLETVSASTEWDTKLGNHCLGVIADGKVNDVAIQWRNYLVAADDAPRVSLAVTLERARSDKFADAERQIIDSLELVKAPTATASAADSNATK
jgi:hypothetical protein